MKTIRVTTDVQVPKVPNFLLYDGGKIRVGDVSDENLKKLGREWTAALLERAAVQRGGKGGEA